MLTSLRCAITFLSLRTNLITFLSLRTNHFSESEDLLLLLSAHVPIDCLFCDSFCQFWERLVTGIRLDFRKGFTRHSRFRLFPNGGPSRSCRIEAGETSRPKHQGDAAATADLGCLPPEEEGTRSGIRPYKATAGDPPEMETPDGVASCQQRLQFC